MEKRNIDIDGKTAEGFHIDLPKAPLLLAKGPKGFVMCGYLNGAVAQKFDEAAAIVRGVSDLDELLAKPVTEATPAAQALGVQTGMSGREALKKFL